MKKLLLTIIILGACLVGNSQNWDSVRVGNIDVDSIMLGGAKIWEKQTVTPPPSGVFTMTTTSTSSTWSPQIVTNTGATLHWEVTGSVTASADANKPTFNFSTAGEKIITITSSDGLLGVSSLRCYNLNITSLDVTGLSNLTELDCNYNSLTSLDVTGLSSLTYLDCNYNSLTSLDVTGLSNLTELYCASNSLTSLDVTGLSNLVDLDCSSNSLTTTSINSILDQLIAIGNTSGFQLKAISQSSGGCGDAAKIAALGAIWRGVRVDACP